MGIRVADPNNLDDGVEMDVLIGKRIDLDMLHYVPEDCRQLAGAADDKIGDKVGQLVIMPVLIPDFTFESWEERGIGAFGTTGR
jgi:hypothetical protein